MKDRRPELEKPDIWDILAWVRWVLAWNRVREAGAERPMAYNSIANSEEGVYDVQPYGEGTQLAEALEPIEAAIASGQMLRLQSGDNVSGVRQVAQLVKKIMAHKVHTPGEYRPVVFVTPVPEVYGLAELDTRVFYETPKINGGGNEAETAVLYCRLFCKMLGMAPEYVWLLAEGATGSREAGGQLQMDLIREQTRGYRGMVSRIIDPEITFQSLITEKEITNWSMWANVVSRLGELGVMTVGETVLGRDGKRAGLVNTIEELVLAEWQEEQGETLTQLVQPNYLTKVAEALAELVNKNGELGELQLADLAKIVAVGYRVKPHIVNLSEAKRGLAALSQAMGAKQLVGVRERLWDMVGEQLGYQGKVLFREQVSN